MLNYVWEKLEKNLGKNRQRRVTLTRILSTLSVKKGKIVISQ